MFTARNIYEVVILAYCERDGIEKSEVAHPAHHKQEKHCDGIAHWQLDIPVGYKDVLHTSIAPTLSMSAHVAMASSCAPVGHAIAVVVVVLSSAFTRPPMSPIDSSLRFLLSTLTTTRCFFAAATAVVTTGGRRGEMMSSATLPAPVVTSRSE